MKPFSLPTVLLVAAITITSTTALAAAPPADANGTPRPAAAPAANEAGTPPATATPPFDLQDAARIAAGKARFNANCAAYCHGHEGSGGKTPAFRGRKDVDPQAIFKVITEGRRGADVMPAWGNGFSAEKRWELVAYIVYLSQLPPAP